MDGNKTPLLTLAVALLAPMAFAHTDGGVSGTPKASCKDLKGDRRWHDYGTTHEVLLLPHDGSLGPKCPCSAETSDPWFDGHHEYARAARDSSPTGSPRAGLDGTYPVYVRGVAGHVWTN